MELNIITKIHKYWRLHEGHHFISIAMEVHNAPERDMDHVIRYYARLFHYRRLGGHLSLSFYIQFFKQHVNIILQQALASPIERKIVLVSDACSRPPITIRSHNLHIGDIKRAMREITPTTKGINFLPFFGSCGLFIFWPLFGHLFVSHVMVLAIDLLLDPIIYSWSSFC